MTVFEKITGHLSQHSIPFKIVRHEATFTSEASAKARGEDVSVGGKAIVMKIDAEYKLFVLSAALKIDSQKLKDYFHSKKIRFASAEELMAVTGLVPGSIPPFGGPILDLELYVDNSVGRHDVIAFNAGSLTDSVVMDTKDYLRIAQPTLLDFSRPL
jgi:prolyl-tRNA editing enzyme YbaK/EbsC (Cys-tRNA(Pro) deacylase)